MDTPDDSPATGEKPKMDSKPQEEMDESTAMLPKSLFGSDKLEPDSEVTLKVVAIHGDEVEVCVCKPDEGEKEGGAMGGAMESIDSMAGDGE